jgi:hypothetical protein
MTALAQTESGKITGTVTDQSGGVLPGASVTLKSSNTQATRTAVSDASGGYTFSNLQPGPYEITVELAGFTSKQYKTTLTVGGSISVNAKLEVGQQTEVITVVGATEGVAVNTVNQEVATNVGEKQLRELPSLTRNAYDFVALAGQASPGDPQNDASTLRGVGFSLNGARTSSVNVLLDGSANNDEFTASVGQNVPLDSVQEFSVITSDFSAQYGRATGGIVNVATKSGTNEWHGTAYEYFRKSSMSAADFDDKARGAKKQDFTRNQPGFSIGGPLQKDKVFFFASYELTKTTSNANTPFLVPSSQLIARTAPNVQAFFQGRLPAGNGGTVNVGQICQQLGCTDGGPFASLGAGFPAFNIVNFQAPVDGGAGVGRKRHQAVGRLDFNISPSTTAYVRYAFEKDDTDPGSVSLSPYDGFNTIGAIKNNNALASITHIFSTSLTSQTKVVYNQLRNEQPLGSAGTTPTLFLTGSDVKVQGASIVFPGYFPTSSGIGIPFGGPQKLLQFYQDFNWVKGKHDIRLGGSFVRIMDDRVFGAYQYGNENLGADPTQGLDNLMTGELVQFSVAIDPKIFPPAPVQLPVGPPVFTRNNRYNEGAAYINDTWSVNSKLKVNLGLRWEIYGVQHNTDPTLDSNFYFGAGDNFFQQFRNGSLRRAPDTSVSTVPGQTGINDIGQLWKTDKNNFAPRVGFAYDVNGDGKTSIRGGYGISYERNFGNVTFNIIQNPPNYGTAFLSANPATGGPLTVGLENLGPLGQPGESPFVSFSLRHIDTNIKTAWAHFWSFSLQHQLSNNVVASLDYTGSKGVDLYSLGNVNARGTAKVYAAQIGLDQATTSPNARLNPIYGSDNMRTNNGKSLYNSVTAGLEGRDIGGSGLSATVRYTWSKSKDNLSSTFSEGINSNTLGFLDPYVGGVGGGPQLDYGFSEFDIRHRVVAGGTWEIPIAKNSSGPTKALLNGWSTSFLFQFHTGLPFSLLDCSHRASPNGAVADTKCMRMLLVAPLGPSGSSNPAAVGTDPNTFSYLDLAAEKPGVGTYVNPISLTSLIGPFPANMTARNEFRGPKNWNLDMTLAKRFNLTDKVNLQIRAEAYNVFNHANLYVDGTTVTANANDFVRAYKTNHRNIQLAARLTF